MSDAVKFEECGNCGRVIGRLETPCVFKEQVVCPECYGRLSPTLEYASPVAPPSTGPSVFPAAEHALIDSRPPTIQTSRPCPACGSTDAAIKKAKGSTAVAVLLLLLWILPGVLYMIFYNGYVYVCPRCRYKYGDAT